MDKKSKLSFVIFKQQQGKSLSFSLSYLSLSVMGLSVLIALFALCIGIYFSFNTNYRQSAYLSLKEENTKQELYINSLDDKFLLIQDKLTDLVEKEEQLELLLGKAIVKKNDVITRN